MDFTCKKFTQTGVAVEPGTANQEFRSALANLSAGVSILTTDGIAGRAGLTVSSVCSVTETPPTILVCVNRSSRAHGAVELNGRVCVNMLGAADTELAREFAGMTQVGPAERFAQGEWEHEEFGIPVLGSALANLTGRVTATTYQGSHAVMFVELECIRVNPGEEGLVYFQRGFHKVGRPLVDSAGTVAGE